MRRLAAIAVTVALAAAACSSGGSHRDLHIGKLPAPTSTAPLAPTIVLPPPDLGRPPIPEPANAGGILPATGVPFGAPIPFTSSVPVPSGLVFVLTVGTDARAGDDPRRAHGDAIHLLCVNPQSRQGTLLGFPRDSWVQIPGHGNGKLTNAMALGGPTLMAETISRLTGLPVQYYVVTGFQGLLLRHAALDSGPGPLLQLAALARRIDPRSITNVVVPGRVGTAAGGQSVVYLGPDAQRVFVDLRPDAVVGTPGPPVTDTPSTTTSTSTTTTLAPTERTTTPVPTSSSTTVPRV